MSVRGESKVTATVTLSPTEEKSLAASEPLLFLLFAKLDPREVRIQEFTHQGSTGKEPLQENNQPSLWQKQAQPEDYTGRYRTNGLIEGVERCRRKNKSTPKHQNP
jgi:hypothetical protein